MYREKSCGQIQQEPTSKALGHPFFQYSITLFLRICWCLMLQKWTQDNLDWHESVHCWCRHVQYSILQRGSVHRVPPTLFVSAGFCFHAPLGLKTQQQSGPVYGSQSAIHWRPGLTTPVPSDRHSERDAAVRHAPHTHKPPSIWLETNKDMWP